MRTGPIAPWSSVLDRETWARRSGLSRGPSRDIAGR